MLSKAEMQELANHCYAHNKFLLLVFCRHNDSIIGYKIYDFPPSYYLLQYSKPVPDNWTDNIKRYKWS